MSDNLLATKVHVPPLHSNLVNRPNLVSRLNEGIARGLMASPKLILLDEPSMGLSPVLVEQIFDTIQSINHSGTSVILVEQNAQMALVIAHRAYVLETGKIVLEGDAQEMLQNPMVIEAYLGVAQ